jgi:hypothetical protein
MSADATRRTGWLLAACGFAYLYVFPYQSRLNNPNENVRLYMTAAIVEEGRYAIDGMRERWGWVNDAAEFGGHLYSVKAPGTSLLGVPAYAAYLHLTRAFDRPFDRTEAVWVCRMFATVLPMLAWLLWFRGWLARHAERACLRDAVFVSVALGSLLYGYGLMFVSHATSAAAAFGAFMLLHDARAVDRRTHARAFAAGLLTASATLFEYPGLVASVVLAVYAIVALRRWRWLLAFLAGGLGPTLVVMHFQWKAFGNPFLPGHLFVENAALRAAHHEGLYGAVGPSAAALYGLTLDPGAGLFPLTPVLALALVGFVVLWRAPDKRAAVICAMALVMLTVLAIASMNNWRGGWTIGPRYLAVTVPFLAWGALVGLESIARHSEGHAFALALGCAAAALVASGLPSAYYPHLPPEVVRPLPDVVWLLVRHGYAPPNAGAWAGVHATASMLPLFGALALAFGTCAAAISGWAARTRACVGAAAIAVVLLVPLHMRAGRLEAILDARAFITRHWEPAGHDAAASLSAALRSRGVLSDAELRRLAAIYDEEGRTREAARVRAGRP